MNQEIRKNSAFQLHLYNRSRGRDGKKKTGESGAHALKTSSPRAQQGRPVFTLPLTHLPPTAIKFSFYFIE
ncbi:hypothetical protein [Dialister sp. CAG:357]|uniref:hypothetical protein n=1 Tax=Dialister sp. CAG:357 TaxID=1262869 RepID=UPI00258893A3|nr:hypothetical protein [Dialister sp. CAG:357]